MTLRWRVPGDRLARAVALAEAGRRARLQEAIALPGGAGLAEVARVGGMESLQASLAAFDGDAELGRILADAVAPLVARAGRPKGRTAGRETSRWSLNLMSPELAQTHLRALSQGDVSLPFCQITWMIPGQAERDRFAEMVADALDKSKGA